MSIKFVFYRDKAKLWRWRCEAANGNVIADSGEGYKRRAGACKGAESLIHKIWALKYTVIALD